MIKNILIKLLIVLVVAALSYSVFWFFKVGQVEKQINKFVSENSSYVSVGEVSVSGFPMSQKILIQDLKFTIPNSVVGNRQVVVKKLEAFAGILSSEFSVSLVEPVTLSDISGAVFSVEFAQNPQITVAITDGKITKFNYQDSGYRIFDAQKSIVYGASSSKFEYSSATDEAENMTAKIGIAIKDIENFDIITIYKNAAEKKIMDGLKTGEISFTRLAGELLQGGLPGENNGAVAEKNLSNIAVNSAAPKAASQTGVASKSDVKSISAQTAANNAQPQAAPVVVQQGTANGSVVQNVAGATSVDSTAVQNLESAVVNAELVKSDFVLDAQYVISPVVSQVSAEQQAQIPNDPTQIQEVPTQYSKVIKINNMEFSNQLYKITVNGELNVFVDDSMPSGAITLKIEKADSLFGYVSTGFDNIVNQPKADLTAADVHSSDLASNGTPVEDSYQEFLRKISAGLVVVSKELASKNPLSTETISQFDIRREKNLEFLINETSVREILGKF